ncbi:hypothetical protein J1605_012594 [Eschrichtius robustus]|uniref:40S ribosomal protein SA n=1 Tax=Eschrichtius robustus TaxID=9764 RepID=A0AB34GLZ1_ESCRO|nr:hypothetical protein J1605_012594 [Eschrichtius robustus]
MAKEEHLGEWTAAAPKFTVFYPRSHTSLKAPATERVGKTTEWS